MKPVYYGVIGVSLGIITMIFILWGVPTLLHEEEKPQYITLYPVPYPKNVTAYWQNGSMPYMNANTENGFDIHYITIDNKNNKSMHKIYVEVHLNFSLQLYGAKVCILPYNNWSKGKIGLSTYIDVDNNSNAIIGIFIYSDKKLPNVVFKDNYVKITKYYTSYEEPIKVKNMCGPPSMKLATITELPFNVVWR